MSKIELSINVAYLPEWGVWEGLRELVQNGKDGGKRDDGLVFRLPEQCRRDRIPSRRHRSWMASRLGDFLPGHPAKRVRQDFRPQQSGGNGRLPLQELLHSTIFGHAHGPLLGVAGPNSSMGPGHSPPGLCLYTSPLLGRMTMTVYGFSDNLARPIRPEPTSGSSLQSLRHSGTRPAWTIRLPRRIKERTCPS